MKCMLCPRRCNIDRRYASGFCRESEKIRVAKVIKNFNWEEPCLSGNKGTLAIFFSGCNLRCEFCQNYEISHMGKGETYSSEEFASFLSSFDYKNLDSIDFITPTQFSYQIVQALKIFKPPVPIIWNSSGYENTSTIRSLNKYVDIFLVDFKFWDGSLSKRLAMAENYGEVASKAILLMTKLKQNFFKGERMEQGVIIRHLILPGHVKDSMQILDYIAHNIPNPFISIMSQFTPNGRGEFKRKITPLEYKTVLAHARKLGLQNGYYQSLDSADDKFVPSF